MLRHFANVLFSKNHHAQLRKISTTNTLYADPPRKKRRIDPALLKLRTERKIIKTEREINKIENSPRFLIPILEYDYLPLDRKDLEKRPKHSYEHGEEQLIAAFKAANRLWALFRVEQAKLEQRELRKVIKSQEKVIQELKKLNQSLYDATVNYDTDQHIVFSSDIVKRETCSNPDYKPPDGYRRDVSQQWIR